MLGARLGASVRLPQRQEEARRALSRGAHTQQWVSGGAFLKEAMGVGDSSEAGAASSGDGGLEPGQEGVWKVPKVRVPE